MRQTCRVLAPLIALGVLVQAATVALAWSQVMGDLEGGAVFDEHAELDLGHVVHGYNGMHVLPLLGLVLLGISSGAARTVPHAREWAGILLGLTASLARTAVPATGAAPAGAVPAQRTTGSEPSGTTPPV